MKNMTFARWLGVLAVSLAVYGCNSNGACVYTQKGSGNEVCVKAKRWDCGGKSYNGKWEAFRDDVVGGDDAALRHTCRALGYESWFGSGYSK